MLALTLRNLGIVATLGLLASPFAAAQEASSGGPQGEEPLRSRRDYCVICHEKESPEVHALHLRGVHAAARVSCAGCHGGNPDGETKEAGHDKEKGYLGPVPRTEIPALCASCHADKAQMIEHGLDAEVVSAWQKSVHGERFLEGDPIAPGCITCHDSHGILSRWDSKSRTFKKRVPESCGSCHSNPRKMEGHDLPTDQYQNYLQGVHGQTLSGKREGDPTAVATCADCHDAHRSQPPDALEVPKICGRCHTQVRSHLEHGPHNKALQFTGEPNCVSCHGEHENAVPELGLIEKRCTDCHEDPQSEGYLAARKMRRLLGRADGSVQSAALTLVRHLPGKEELERRTLEARYGEILSLYAKIRRRAHGLDLQEMESLVNRLIRKTRATTKTATADLEAYPGFPPYIVILVLCATALGLLLASIIAARFVLKLTGRHHRKPSVVGEEMR